MSLSNISSTLKNIYGPSITEQLNRPLPLYNLIRTCPLLEKMCKRVKIRPVPMTVNKLIRELNKADPTGKMKVYTSDYEMGGSIIEHISYDNILHYGEDGMYEKEDIILLW